MNPMISRRQNLNNRIVFSFPVSNLTLTTLTVHDSVASRDYLGHLSLPALTSLTLVSSYTAPARNRSTPTLPVAVERLIAQSNCNIKHARLENTPTSSRDFVAFLRLLTTLETLELHPPPYKTMDTWHLPSLLEALSRNTGANELDRRGPDLAGPILPNLTSFYVGCQWSNDWTTQDTQETKEAFTDFVEHPQRWPASGKSGAALAVPGGANPTQSSSQCARLENAQLFRCGPNPTSLECHYVRGRRAVNYV
jgi:hypothetical protein